MIEVYHWEPHGASARVLICLNEKEVGFRGHYIDVLALEQFRPAFGRVEPSGELPVLVQDGLVYTGATPICELIEESHAQPALLPADPYGRWQARVWQKSIDDAFGPSVSEVAWDAYGVPLPEVDRIVPREQRPLWQAAARGYGEEQLARARRRIHELVGRMEAALAHAPWLAGAAFSLADVAAFAYFKFLPAICPEIANAAATPRAIDWLAAVESRPAVQHALSVGRAPDPFAVAAPAPEQIRWG
jgi:glutathione S-transferase